jgi:dihydroflavonol-4-reductase
LRTLVTGATGFIGRPLVRMLVERGDEVRVLARPSSNLSALEGLAIQVVRGDVTQPDTLPTALAGVQKVFHAAGLVSMARSDRPRLHEVNVGGTRNLMDAALQAGVERVIYTSSISAVGYSRRPELVREDTVWVDYGISYAQSKRAAEEEAFAISRKGLPLVVVNPTMAMGANDPNLTSTAVVARYLRGDLTVRVDGGLNVLHVDDFAAGHILADERGRPGERYILGDTNVTWGEFFRILNELSGKGIPRRIPAVVARAAAALSEFVIARRTGKPPKIYYEEAIAASLYRVADSSKAIRELGLPQRPLRDTLKETVDWLQASGRVAASA